MRFWLLLYCLWIDLPILHSVHNSLTVFIAKVPAINLETFQKGLSNSWRKRLSKVIHHRGYMIPLGSGLPIFPNTIYQRTAVEERAPSCFQFFLWISQGQFLITKCVFTNLVWSGLHSVCKFKNCIQVNSVASSKKLGLKQTRFLRCVNDIHEKIMLD